MGVTIGGSSIRVFLFTRFPSHPSQAKPSQAKPNDQSAQFLVKIPADWRFQQKKPGCSVWFALAGLRNHKQKNPNKQL